jgi:hypothetical protein
MAERMTREERANLLTQAEGVLDRRVPDAKCPICEHKGGWGMLERGSAVVLYEPGNAAILGPAGLDCVFRFCLNCGFVRQHYANVLMLD